MTTTEDSISSSATAGKPCLLAEPLADSFSIETARLRLRPPCETDIDALHAAIESSLAEISQWMPWCLGGYTREQCADWIRTGVENWRVSAEFPLVIEHAESGRVLGSIGLNRVDAIGRWANLGYWVRTDEAGKGYVSEAAVAVVRFGLDVLRLWRIEIFADVDNARSRGVAEKIGAVFEGVARNRANVGERVRDAAVYSVVPGSRLEA
jgi:ribosomal-protein-serine acetyltransferase